MSDIIEGLDEGIRAALPPPRPPGYLAPEASTAAQPAVAETPAAPVVVPPPPVRAAPARGAGGPARRDAPNDYSYRTQGRMALLGAVQAVPSILLADGDARNVEIVPSHMCLIADGHSTVTLVMPSSAIASPDEPTFDGRDPIYDLDVELGVVFGENVATAREQFLDDTTRGEIANFHQEILNRTTGVWEPLTAGDATVISRRDVLSKKVTIIPPSGVSNPPTASSFVFEYSFGLRYTVDTNYVYLAAAGDRYLADVRSFGTVTTQSLGFVEGPQDDNLRFAHMALRIRVGGPYGAGRFVGRMQSVSYGG
ncbi:hypothetical protein [Salinarimonas rosea]|uniref:hypothetical protein n=1 Tax=Salinarimonas rosea TaxID=552063 RepID=UPI0003FBE9DA|nr:hypothetical protein [Salinarimonas rosea]